MNQVFLVPKPLPQEKKIENLPKEVYSFNLHVVLQKQTWLTLIQVIGVLSVWSTVLQHVVTHILWNLAAWSVTFFSPYNDCFACVDLCGQVRHCSRADRFNSNLCVYFNHVHCAVFRSRYIGLLFLVDARARRSNSAEFSTEQSIKVSRIAA